MLSLATRNLTNCKSLVVTMNDDLHIVKVMKTNIDQFLCDVGVVMSFICIMPMLEVMHEFIKFA